MASINKLSIRGIRSFSPERDETIEFYSPLTMIVGANGCGKTTIIECLKYACTGALPPSARSGQSFVNDPSMTDSTEVKANMKLRFTNKSQKVNVVIRSFSLTKKRTKVEFKALDGVIRTTNDDGEKISLTQKCSELDRHVPDLLGVSSAILENVVFCHQEDSCWPLGEGALLKKKFDDIFESTRYSKALEAIQKTKKDFQSKAKDIKGEVMECAAHLKAAQDMQVSLEVANGKRGAAETDLQRLSDEIQSLDSKLERCREVTMKWEAAEKEMQHLQAQQETLKRRISDKRSSLEVEYDDSDDSLRNQIENFDEEMGKKQRELLHMQRNLEAISRDISGLRSTLDKLNTRRGEAYSIEQQFEQKKNELVDFVTSVSKNFNMPSPQAYYGTREFKQFLETITMRMEVTDKEAKQAISQSRMNSDNAVSDLQLARGDVQRITLDINSKDKELEGIKRERSQLLLTGSKKSYAAPSNIVQAQQDFDQTKLQYDEFMSTYKGKQSSCQNAVKETENQIRDLTASIASDDQLLQILRANRSDVDKLQLQEKQAVDDENGCKKELQVLFDVNLRDILGDTLLPNRPDDMQRVIKSLEMNIKERKNSLLEKRDSLKSVRNDLSQREVLFEQDRKRNAEISRKLEGNGNIQTQLFEYVKELNGLQYLAEDDEDEDAQRNASTDDDISLLIDRSSDLEGKIIKNDNSLEVAKTYRESLMKKAIKKQECPCCARKMDSKEKEIFDQSMNKLFRDHGESYAKLKEGRERAAMLKQNLSKLKGAIDSCKVLDQELNDLTASLSSCQKRIDEQKDKERMLVCEIDGLESLLKASEECLMKINSLKDRWEDVSCRIRNLVERKLRHSQSFHADDTGGRTYTEIEEQQRVRAKDKDECSRKKEQMQQEDAMLSKQMLTLKGKLFEVEKDLLEAKQVEEKQVEVEQRLSNLKVKDDDILESKQILQRELTNAERSLREKEGFFEETKIETARTEREKNAAIAMLQSEVDRVVNSSNSLEEIERRVTTLNLKSITDEVNNVQSEIQIKENTLRELTPKINATSAEIQNSERLKRGFQENLNLRLLKKELLTITQQLEHERKVHGASTSNEYNEAQRKLQRTAQEKQQRLIEQAAKNGAMAEMTDQITNIERKITSGPYKDIKERHRTANIKHETTLMAVTDLDCYFTALDRALQTFHSMKMKEINKIIRELWQLTYRGEDIDLIELVSGQEGAGGNVGNAARSFNYRVVMHKGDSCLEMRGRCSAGQRVLAALVIRLALAETFCLNCGILALDEPTTNLDEANRAGLAHALARIIGGRTKQTNFQLLTITHDEEFVRLMSNELSSQSGVSMPEHYFRVSRLEDSPGKYFSHIERIPWEEM